MTHGRQVAEVGSFYFFNEKLQTSKSEAKDPCGKRLALETIRIKSHSYDHRLSAETFSGV